MCTKSWRFGPNVLDVSITLRFYCLSGVSLISLFAAPVTGPKNKVYMAN